MLSLKYPNERVTQELIDCTKKNLAAANVWLPVIQTAQSDPMRNKLLRVCQEQIRISTANLKRWGQV